MQSLRRDGATLFYDEAVGDGPPILLVHGWCCDHNYFAPQFEHYASRCHRVVAVDLRGHGRSDKPEQNYTIRLFADDLVWICHRIGLEKPLVVGHSMGGVVAFDLAARYPDVPSAVAMLDAAVVLPSAASDAISSFLEELRGPGYREMLRDYVANALFISTDDQERKKLILESMSSAPQHVMVSAMEDLRDYDPTEATGGLAMPAVYIAADELQPRSDMARFHELAPQIFYGKTVGSGHFCQLEVPAQVNAMIDRFLAIRPLIAT